MSAIPLLNNDEPYVKLNNPPLPPDNTSIFIVTNPLFSLSQESTSIIIDYLALDYHWLLAKRSRQIQVVRLESLVTEQKPPLDYTRSATLSQQQIASHALTHLGK